MLRCLKWLPLVCPLLFLVCFGTGWIFGKPPEKVIPTVAPIVPPPAEKMSFIFSKSIYDLNGKPIAATIITNNKDTGKLVPIDKQTNVIGIKQYITVKPEDSTRYREAGLEVTWLNRGQFLAWLKSDFEKSLRAKGADLQKWDPVLKKLENDASDTSCNYPVVIDRK